MKALKISWNCYSYPDGCNSLEAFANILNQNYHSFIKLRRFNDENCAFPYFIEDECEDVYLNVANINNLEEVDITVLPKYEYEERLKKVVGTVCVNCANYEEDNVGDNLEGHRDQINLDGKCNSYTPLKK